MLYNSFLSMPYVPYARYGNNVALAKANNIDKCTVKSEAN